MASVPESSICEILAPRSVACPCDRQTVWFVVVRSMRITFLLLCSVWMASARALEVTQLRCEDLVAPVGVDLAQPKLSWQMQDGGNTRGLRQTAYQILVASSSGLFGADTGDLWDSGQVASSQSLRVAYVGSALASPQRAYWKVRLWDQEGHVSAWSMPSEWTMGLLSPADWTAKWIAHSASGLDGAGWIWFNEGNPASSAPVATRMFRRTLRIPADRTLASARVRITADNAFTLRINGKTLASGSDWTRPVAMDIGPALQVGDNLIEVSATNSGSAPGPAGLIARMDVTFTSGAPLSVVTDAQWQASSDGAAWSPALSLGACGISPWGSVASANFPHPWMRRNFEVSGEVRRALVFVNTPGHFELYLNGRKVSDDVLAPAYSDFNKRMFVVGYDVTALLQPGSNCIALWTAPGWYQPRYGNPYGSPIVRAQLDIETSTGSLTVGTDASWRSKESSISQVGSWGWADMGGERWNDAEFIPDWNLASLDDTAWSAAREITPPNVLHTWPAMPGSRTLEPVPAAQVSKINGKWVVDFGKNICGWVRLRMRGLTPGQQITIDHADLVGPPELMHIADANGFQSFGQRNVFIAGNSATAEYCTRFSQHAFRYAILDGLTAAPELSDVTALPVMTALEPAGSFESSNPLFNKIHAITMATYRAQIPVGVLGGGETREKEGYGDAGAFLTGMLYNFRSDAYFRKWLDDWTDGQRADGFIQHTAPKHVDHGGGPPWGGQASELTRRLLLYHGDDAPIPAVYDHLKRYVDFIETKTVNDIVRYYSPYNDNGPWFLGDWVTPTPSENEHGFPNDSMDEKEFFNNCYRVILWDQLAMLAERMGNRSEAQRCRDRLAVLRPRIHAEFFDAATGSYRASRQAFLTIALLARIMPDELRPAILQRLVDNITITRNGHLGTGLIGTSFLLDLLAREGRNDLAAMMMNQKTYPSWGFLSEVRSCTTWPETWTGWGSQIILVTGSPGAWFHEGLLGLRPDAAAPGFKKFSVIPGVVREVDWARATHDSPYGNIAVEWRKQADRRIAVNVSVPPNTSAEVHVPAAAAGDVAESGVAASAAPGVQFLRMENGCAVFAVGAGVYAFTGVLPAALGPVVEVQPGLPQALDFSGSQTISSLLLGGVAQAAGTYSATTHPDWFSGTGSLLVMPESRN